MRYYQKEIPESGVIINGTTMRFDLLETEDSILISELDKCIERGVGGVVSITKEHYDDEVKKKGSGLSSPNSLKPLHQRQELSANQLAGLRAAGVVSSNADGQFAAPQMGRNHTPNNRFGLPNGKAQMPDPIEVPTADDFSAAFAKPPTAKMSEVKAAV
jgi:hypothetical protein